MKQNKRRSWEFGLALGLMLLFAGQTEKLYSRLIKSDPIQCGYHFRFDHAFFFHSKQFVFKCLNSNSLWNSLDDKWMFFANCSMTSIKLSMFFYYFFFCGSRSVLPVILSHAFFCWHSILAVKAVVFFHVIFFWNFPFGRFLLDPLFTEALSDKALKAWANKYLRKKLQVTKEKLGKCIAAGKWEFGVNFTSWQTRLVAYANKLLKYLIRWTCIMHVTNDILKL